MSKDQMQEVYPVLVNYVDGEKPTATKLNGVLKQTKSSFDAITKAIGDPWDAQDHISDLSPENIAIPSLARIIGPSDYLSNAFTVNDDCVPTITLEPDRNSWSVGFPLVETVTTISPDSDLDDFTPISGITGRMTFYDSADNDLFVTEKTTRDAVVARGDYYVDYYRGEIVCFEPTVDYVEIELSAFNLIGPGAPWATQNVIPSWKETTYLCSLSAPYTSSGSSVYVLTLPYVRNIARVGTNNSIGAVKSKSYNPTTQYDVSITNISYRYLMPESMVSGAWTDGDELPEGSCLLWDDSLGRVIPSVTFEWINETSVRLITPEDWLDGTAPTNRYRLIITGASIAEQVNWLAAAFRDNRHVGLTDGASVKKTVSFTNPICHKEVTERYNGYVPDSYTRSAALFFRESSLPTNDHPQYLHRYGYASDDLNGNTANAMRGWLTFSTQNNYVVGDIAPNSNTYGISFGGATTTSGSNHPRLSFEGGFDESTRFPFGVPETGAVENLNPSVTRQHIHGALTYTPWYGAPMFIRGAYSGDDEQIGGILGFDLGQTAEANYIKLMPAYRDNGSEVANIPATIDQTISAALSITPALSDLAGAKRLAAEQVREWRFRGVPKLTGATNTGESIGFYADDDGDTSGSEFDYHFTSPGAIGADFVNVYSNAIFFSDTGDGKQTSFTVHGKDWIDDGNTEDIPTGIYYVPAVNGSSEAAEIYQNFTEEYIKITGDETANYKSGEYVEFKVTSSGLTKTVRIINVLLSGGNTLLLINESGVTDFTDADAGTIYKKTGGYFSLYNQHSDQSSGTGAISLSCGVNHGFAYFGSKFFALSGYSIDGTDIALDLYTYNNLISDSILVATHIKDHNTLVVDSARGKHLGIHSYDGRVNIAAWNTFDEGETNDTARHVWIYTSALDASNSPKVGNIRIEAGLGVTTPDASDCSVYIDAYNDISLESANGYISLSSKEKTEITSSDSFVNVVGQTYFKAESPGYVMLKGTATGSVYGVRLDSKFGVKIYLDDNTLAFENTSSSSMAINANNGLSIESLSGNLSLGSTGGNISIIPGTGVLILSGITEATSDTGLASGQIWIDTSDGRTLKVKA